MEFTVLVYSSISKDLFTRETHNYRKFNIFEKHKTKTKHTISHLIVKYKLDTKSGSN